MELSDFLGEELLAFCSNDTEVHGPGHEDEDLDTLFAFVFNDFESIPDSAPSNVIPATQSQTSYTPTPASSSSGRLAPPKTEEVQEARNTGIPKKTIEDTKYCVKVWAEWCSYCREACGHAIPTLESIESTALAHLFRARGTQKEWSGIFSQHSPPSVHWKNVFFSLEQLVIC